MARAGVGSRRMCERLIEEGSVAVNGRIVRTLPVLVDPASDRIEVKGEELAVDRAARLPSLVYVMLFKPRRTMTTLDDPEGRRTVHDLVQHPSGARLFPVGRLDYDTMGLVLMTNDGELANRLTHPRYGVHKTYRAIVKGTLSREDVASIQQGMHLADRKRGRTVGASRTKPATIEIVRTERTRTILDITISEGRNRQIWRLLAAAGCPVRKLVRIRMGPLKLKGVSMGQWRPLTSREVAALKRAATKSTSRANSGRGAADTGKSTRHRARNDA